MTPKERKRNITYEASSCCVVVKGKKMVEPKKSGDIWLDDVNIIKSPNFSYFRDRATVGIIIHYTGGGTGGATKWFTMPESKVSAHLVIDRSGEYVDQLVPLNKAAWHAGRSEAPYFDKTTPNVNQFTIGIELENYGNMQRIDGKFYIERGRRLKEVNTDLIESIKYSTMKLNNSLIVKGFWEEYPKAQLETLKELIEEIKEAVPTIEWIAGHDSIARPSGKKIDPGPLFPMNKIAKDLKLNEIPGKIRRRYKVIDIEF